MAINLRQEVGNAVEALGMLVAPWAPDTGISEAIAGGPTTYTQAKAYTPSTQPQMSFVNQSYLTPEQRKEIQANGNNTSSGGGTYPNPTINDQMTAITLT